MRPGAGGELAGNSKAQKSSETHPVEPDGARIGDRSRDVDAGAQAGCRTAFIDSGYRERGPTNPPSKTSTGLREAVEWILAESGGRTVSDSPPDAPGAFAFA